MKNILTLISNPAAPGLTEKTLRQYKDALADLGAVHEDIAWLSEGEAADIAFDSDLEAAREALAPLLEQEALDFALQPLQHRRKKLLVADMDSTIIQVECIDELADFAGLKEKVSAITEAAMRGELDFEQALRERVGLLRGMDTAVLEKVFKERVVLTPGAVEMVQTMNKSGANTVLVSGGFTFFTDRVARLTGFQVNRGNILGIDGDQLSGEVEDPIVDSNTKLDSLHEFQDIAGLEMSQTIAVGDGANDIPMIDAAGLGVAFHPKPAAAKAADVVIRHGDLTALLYIQGFQKSEFVTG
ncbi:phosphoserine phosphatase SerB [Emcibacter nanhaiensis]|uniref:Phosphoserine phosphatase n=1 Tax=Emcibacter nanhaiensis TaxID=1505037 RepID=A0A501PB45_9PROT|nr:phosphoserine phosphatase SerB [Emcibacter nanhaiensis]TPD57583.1 phosphoserine phosphatase SerB [Emcibacter nanhaiensis]